MDVCGSLKKYFDTNNCLLKLSEEIKTPFIESNVEDVSKGVLCFLFGQLRNIYESVSILCRRGFSQQAYILLRSLQEGYIRICYILHEEKKETVVTRAREWIEHDVIERKKMLDSVEKGKGLNSEVREKWLKQKDDLLRSYKEIKKRGRLWPQESIKNLCEEANLQNEYLLYRHFSSKGHLSPRSAFGQVIVNGRRLGYRWGPTKERKEITPVLGLAHRYFLLILVRLSLYFGVEPSQKLRWHIGLRRDLPNDAKKLLKLRFDIYYD